MLCIHIRCTGRGRPHPNYKSGDHTDELITTENRRLVDGHSTLSHHQRGDLMWSRIRLRHALWGIFVASAGIANADTLLWSDDFESYATGSFPSDGGWFIRPGAPGVGTQAQYVSTDRAYSGTRSVRLEGAEGLGINVQKLITLPGTRFAFEALANTTRVDSRSVGVGFGTQDEVYALVQFRHNGVIAARS